MEENKQEYELNNDGSCSSCDEVAIESEFVGCALCKKKFHVVCKVVGTDDKWATKSMMLTYKSPSTKKNFKFFCNCCETTMETNMADVDCQRIRRMERNMDAINNELREIKELVKAVAATKSTEPELAIVDGDSSTGTERSPTNIWQDTEKLATVKAKPAESILVINNSSDSEKEKTNTELVENTIIEGRIPIKKSFKSKNGNLVVVCESAESRNTLMNQVSAVNNGIEMRMPNENRPVVSIVGLSKSYEKEEVVEILQKQNYFLGQFSENNEIQDHIKVFAVKPLKGKPHIFQAFARVSKLVRQGFKTYNDKVTIGLNTCKIYDQYHIKRCNNCQGFGHFYKDCPTPQTSVCAKCGENHATKDCSSSSTHCVNCASAELSDLEHRSDDHNCPSLRKQQEKLKINLNMQR